MSPRKKKEPVSSDTPAQASRTPEEEAAEVSAAFRAQKQTEQADTPAKRGRPRKQAVPVLGADPEEAKFWGETLQGFWNNLATVRAYPLMTDAARDQMAEAAALTAQKFLPDGTKTDRPWLSLLIQGAPYLGSAAKVEYDRFSKWLETRRNGDRAKRPNPSPIRIPHIPAAEPPAPEPAADVGAPGHHRDDGQREDDPNAGFDTIAITGAGG